MGTSISTHQLDIDNNKGVYDNIINVKIWQYMFLVVHRDRLIGVHVCVLRGDEYLFFFGWEGCIACLALGCTFFSGMCLSTYFIKENKEQKIQIQNRTYIYTSMMTLMVEHVWLALGIWLARRQQKPNEENDTWQLRKELNRARIVLDFTKSSLLFPWIRFQKHRNWTLIKHGDSTSVWTRNWWLIVLAPINYFLLFPRTKAHLHEISSNCVISRMDTQLVYDVITTSLCKYVICHFNVWRGRARV